MSLTNRSAELSITELAVNPADVDRSTYPVRLRLSRRLKPHEIEALAGLMTGATIEKRSLVLPEASLDDVAREVVHWNYLLGEATRIGDERSGADVQRAQELADNMRAHRQGGTLPDSFMH